MPYDRTADSRRSTGQTPAGIGTNRASAGPFEQAEHDLPAEAGRPVLRRRSGLGPQLRHRDAPPSTTLAPVTMVFVGASSAPWTGR